MKAYIGAVTTSVLLLAPSLLAADSDRLPSGDVTINAELAVIANPRSSESRLLKAMQSLRGSEAPAAFWAEIANDSRYSAKHRGYCAAQLFKRHIKPGMTLAEVAALLNGADWLNEKQIHGFVVLGGYVPVRHDNIGGLFCIHMLPDEKRGPVYISFTTSLSSSSSELLNAFQGKAPATIGNVKVLDINVFKFE
jgi:hypothetical protein